MRLDAEEARRREAEAELRQAAQAGVALLNRNQELERMLEELKQQSAACSVTGRPSDGGSSEGAPIERCRSSRKLGFKAGSFDSTSDGEHDRASVDSDLEPEADDTPPRKRLSRRKRWNAEKVEELIEANEALRERSHQIEEERGLLEKQLRSAEEANKHRAGRRRSSQISLDCAALPASVVAGLKASLSRTRAPQSSTRSATERPADCGGDDGVQSDEDALERIEMLREQLSEKEAQLRAASEHSEEIESLLTSMQADLRANKQECDELRTETAKLSRQLQLEKQESLRARDQMEAALAEKEDLRQRVDCLTFSQAATRERRRMGLATMVGGHAEEAPDDVIPGEDSLAAEMRRSLMADAIGPWEPISEESGTPSNHGERDCPEAVAAAAEPEDAPEPSGLDASKSRPPGSRRDSGEACQDTSAPQPCSSRRGSGEARRASAGEARAEVRQLRQELAEASAATASAQRELSDQMRRDSEARGELRAGLEAMRERLDGLEQERGSLHEEAQTAARQFSALDAQNQALIGQLQCIKISPLSPPQEVGFWESLVQNITCTRCMSGPRPAHRAAVASAGAAAPLAMGHPVVAGAEQVAGACSQPAAVGGPPQP